MRQTKHVRSNWPWLLGLGIIFLILGCIALSMVVGITLVSMLFLGVLLIIAGVVQIIDVGKSREWRGMIWHALIGLFYLIIGGIVIYDPFLASTIITILIAWVLILIGISRVMMAVSVKQAPGWGWLLLAGILSIGLGILILIQWPWSGLFIIGLFISIELIVNGWTFIFLALSHSHAD